MQMESISVMTFIVGTTWMEMGRIGGKKWRKLKVKVLSLIFMSQRQ